MEPIELRARRRGLGLDQAQLADLLGVRQHTVSRWECGERHISDGVDSDLRDLEDALETMIDNLVDLAVHKSAMLDTPEVTIEIPAGLPPSLCEVAAARAAVEVREEGIVARIVGAVE